MRKITFTLLAVSGLFLATSCGDGDKESSESSETSNGPSLCDCVNEVDPSEECEEMRKEWEAEFESATEDRKREMMQQVERCIDAHETEAMEDMDSDVMESGDPEATIEAAEEICGCMEPVMALQDRALELQNTKDEEKATELMEEYQAAQSESMACIGSLQEKYEDIVSERELQQEIMKACPETAALMFGTQ